ncbi:hypothetical protein HYW32_00190 [Candidatus Berkelbacteria bacterium]|nr:hypothetical protein [Candidatus Berkelbacteria bacterium]
MMTRARLLSLVGGLGILGLMGVGIALNRSEASSITENFFVQPQEGVEALTVTATYADYLLIEGTELTFQFDRETTIVNPSGQNIGSVKYTTVTHRYQKPGNYSVKLIAKIPLGDGKILTKIVRKRVKVSKIKPGQYFSIEPPSGLAPLGIKAVYADYFMIEDTKLVFDFGDGTVSEDSGNYSNNTGSVKYTTAFHRYNEPGKYTVGLTVKTPIGGDEFREKTVKKVVRVQQGDLVLPVPTIRKLYMTGQGTLPRTEITIEPRIRLSGREARGVYIEGTSITEQTNFDVCLTNEAFSLRAECEQLGVFGTFNNNGGFDWFLWFPDTLFTQKGNYVIEGRAQGSVQASTLLEIVRE